MMYVEGGAVGHTKTKAQRWNMVTNIAGAAADWGSMSVAAVKIALATAASGMIAALGAVGGMTAAALAAFEGTLAAAATTYASQGKNYYYKYYSACGKTFYTNVYI